MNTQLPIHEIRESLLEVFGAHRRLVLQAPTGSGKSTQVPQMLIDGGLVDRGQIVVLQPRRLAARMLAARVAEERGSPVGREVGYQVRFTNRTGRDTRIRYVTEGIVLREILSRPELNGIHTLIFDEFHERHLYGDVTLAQALRIQESVRPDLKIIVMSATLDSATLEQRLTPCGVLTSEGRVFPVRMEYLARPVRTGGEAVWDVAAAEFDRQMKSGAGGDVLVFMPGAYEIARTCRSISSLPSARGIDVLPLHGELREQDQDRAVRPGERRKVVVATNVAETSLTIDGIGLVIDSGLARIPRFDPHRGINTLLIEPICRASADQRAGRAGRTGPGHCMRLWTEREHQQRPEHLEPEIRRVDLSEIILILKSISASPRTPARLRDDDLSAFPWIDPPDARALDRSVQLLTDLGALEPNTKSATPIGRSLVQFPVHPRFSRMLVAAGDYGCVPSAALVAALTSERNLLLRRQNQVVREHRERKLEDDVESDLFRMIEAWRFALSQGFDVEACSRLGIHAMTARKVERLASDFMRIAEHQGLDTDSNSDDPDALRKCVLIGFVDQLGRRLRPGSARCLLVHRRRGTIDKESVVRKCDLLVASEIREIDRKKGEVDVMLSLCTGVREEWLEELYPEEFSEQRTVRFDTAQKRVVALAETLFRDMAVRAKPVEPLPEEAARILADLVMDGRLTLKKWNTGVDQWLFRVNTLARACPELGIPVWGDDDRRAMLEQVCLGAVRYKDIKDRDVLPTVRNWLSGEQRALVDQHAPERVPLANGRSPKVLYADSGPPVIQARIQELYGVEGPVDIAMNRVRVRFHVLAPNHRPVQITEDLSLFWREQYPKVRSELQKKYPKHEWR